MLKVNDLHAFYGKSHVLHGVHFDVRPGEIVSLLGRNGSGRSPAGCDVACDSPSTWQRSGGRLPSPCRGNCHGTT